MLSISEAEERAAALVAAAVKAGASHGIAPLLASDEEGGKVQRLKRVLGDLPSAAEMGTWPDARIEQTAHAADLGAFMNRRLGSVFINEAQGSPLQPDVQFRGFVASPLLGQPQGISENRRHTAADFGRSREASPNVREPRRR